MKLSIILPLACFFLTASSRPASKKIGRQQEESQKPKIPHYLLELYNKGDILSGANTARSLQNVASIEQCNHFNFSLRGIDNTHERIVSSELYLYMIRHEVTENSLYVVIRDEGATPLKVLEVLPNQESGWLMFDLNKEVASLVKSGKSHIVLNIDIYQDNDNSVELDCTQSPISLVNSPADDDTAPYLAVQSDDSFIDQIDYKAILDRMRSTAAKSRKRRSYGYKKPKVPTCEVMDLTVPIGLLELPEFKILAPKSYDAGICGGECQEGLQTNHAQWINAAIDQLELPLPGGSGLAPVVVSTCAPLNYDSLAMIVLYEQESTARIKYVPDAKITSCGCVDVIEYGTSE